MEAYFGPTSAWFWGMMQFMAVSITLFLIYLQVRIQTASHIVSTINSINSRWQSEALLRARHQCCQSWLDHNYEFIPVAETIAEFIEDIGTIVRVKAVPQNVIWETHSWYIEHYYYMYKKGIEKDREKYKDPTLYTQFEWLFHQISKISTKKGAPDFNKTDEEIEKFARSEVESATTLLQLKDEIQVRES